MRSLPKGLLRVEANTEYKPVDPTENEKLEVIKIENAEPVKSIVNQKPTENEETSEKPMKNEGMGDNVVGEVAAIMNNDKRESIPRMGIDITRDRV